LCFSVDNDWVENRVLESETLEWERTAAIIARFFKVKAEDLS
jgi:hypothetical protein